MNKDLTEGKPYVVLWKFCLPLFCSIIFQQLYNLADSFVAGKFGGENALAAVGNGYEITLILIAFAFGCNIGGSVIVSKFFGAKEYDKMKTSVYTTLIASAVICVALMLLGCFTTSALLGLINTPSDILADSALYLKIYILGLPFVFLYNVSSGIFAGLGDSRTPFIFLVCSSLANIGMDFGFAFLFDNVVSGVAWATFICQGISCFAAIGVLILKLKKIPSQKKTEIFSWQILKEISIVAIPSILQQSFISVGNIIIQSIINKFGASAIAGYSAAIKLNNLVITSFTTLGNGVSNFTSQNLGAGKPKRVKDGYLSGLVLVWMICIPIVLLYMTAGRNLIGFLIENPTETALQTGRQFLLIVSPFYFIVSSKLVSDGVLRGSKMMAKFMCATFTDLALRIVLAEILSVPLKTTGIWLAWPIGWCVSTVLSVIFYNTGIWNKNKSEKIKNKEYTLPYNE